MRRLGEQLLLVFEALSVDTAVNDSLPQADELSNVLRPASEWIVGAGTVVMGSVNDVLKEEIAPDVFRRRAGRRTRARQPRAEAHHLLDDPVRLPINVRVHLVSQGRRPTIVARPKRNVRC
jgi:hypothetical protein